MYYFVHKYYYAGEIKYSLYLENPVNHNWPIIITTHLLYSKRKIERFGHFSLEEFKELLCSI